VEEVFTFLSERNNAPRTPKLMRLHTQKVWNALVEETGRVFARFGPNMRTRSVFRSFRKNHIRSRDTIVSFNYDVVFEGSLPSTWRWYYGGIDHSHKPGALRILKPHGSINWAEVDGDVTHYSDEFPQRPVIVAPTHLKFIGTTIDNEDGDPPQPTGYLNQSPEIADVWGMMEAEMREAKGFVFIGYSFPPADLYFSSILRSVLVGRDREPFVVLVNPEAPAIQNHLRSRFAIRPERMRTFFDLETFNQVERHQIAKMF
jgi:hypothetical protein